MLNSIMHSSHLLMTEGMKEGRKEARTEESRAAASIPSGFMRPLLVLLLLLHDPPRVMIPNFRSLPLSLPPSLPRTPHSLWRELHAVIAAVVFVLILIFVVVVLVFVSAEEKALRSRRSAKTRALSFTGLALPIVAHYLLLKGHGID